MTIELFLKKPATALDLCLCAAKRRLSPRTGFIHLFQTDFAASDTIPLYENFCYALALCRLKKGETIGEAKELLLRLFPFQGEEGNFPIYLHDFPRCYDPHNGLKIAPLLLRLLRDYGSVLGQECRAKLELAFNRALAFSATRQWSPLWQFRFLVLEALRQNQTPERSELERGAFTAADWWEYYLTLQWIETPRCPHFHTQIQAYCGPAYGDRQWQFEPCPNLIEWAIGGQSERLTRDDPRQLQLAALEKLEIDDAFTADHHSVSSPNADHHFRLLWNDGTLHSLVLPKLKYPIGVDGTQFTLALPTEFELGRDDLIECALYCDASPQISLWINGEKGTVFALGDTVEIRSKALSAKIAFELIGGEGQFTGHLLFGNRPGQIGQTGYEVYDWKIGLRTLRRSADCTLKLSIQIAPHG